MRLTNMSHSLSAAAKAALEEMVGETVEEIVIPVQFDTDAPLRPQFDALLDDHRAELWGMDLFIPPAFAPAAAYITARLSYAQSDAMLPVPPDMVVLRREGTPPQFVPAEILRG